MDPPLRAQQCRVDFGAMAGPAATVDTRGYYNNYSGHPIPDLRAIKAAMGDRTLL